MPRKPPPVATVPFYDSRRRQLALEMATAAIQAGHPRDAERLAAEVLDSNAENLAALQLYGVALLMQDRGQEAIAPLERAARQSHEASTETWLAMALHQVGRDEEARVHFECAVKRKPPFPPAFLEFANLVSVQEPDKAIAILQQGLTAAPGEAAIFLALGRLYEGRGKLTEAYAAFAQAVTIAPRDVKILFALARTLLAKREFAQAAEAYRRILAVTPQDIDAEIGLGISLTELGQGDEALSHLRAASSHSMKTFGEVVGALADAGHGRFWLRVSDARRVLRGNT